MVDGGALLFCDLLHKEASPVASNGSGRCSFRAIAVISIGKDVGQGEVMSIAAAFAAAGVGTLLMVPEGSAAMPGSFVEKVSGRPAIEAFSEAGFPSEVDRLRCSYRYVFVDCQLSLSSQHVRTILNEVDSMLITVSASHLSLGALAHLLDTVAEVRKSLNPALFIEGVLITSYDECFSDIRRNADTIRSIFGGRVFNTLIRSTEEMDGYAALACELMS